VDAECTQEGKDRVFLNVPYDFTRRTFNGAPRKSQMGGVITNDLQTYLGGGAGVLHFLSLKY